MKTPGAVVCGPLCATSSLFLKRISADWVYLLMPWAAQDKSGLVPLRLTNSRKLRRRPEKCHRVPQVTVKMDNGRCSREQKPMEGGWWPLNSSFISFTRRTSNHVRPQRAAAEEQPGKFCVEDTTPGVYKPRRSSPHPSGSSST